MTAQTQPAVGIDLGATKIAGALVAPDGEVLATGHQPTMASQGVPAVVNNLVDIINKLLAQTDRQAAGIGIGSPGLVNPATGVVRNAVNLGWDEVALGPEIQVRLAMDLPIYVHKDANAEVVGEAFFGAGQGCRDLVYIGIGSGLGGGAMVNGHLILGDTLNASEIGHLVLGRPDRSCSCGLSGCAETVVSGPGLLAVTRDYLAGQAYPTRLHNTPELSSYQVIAAAYARDPLALAVLAEVSLQLSLIVAAYVAILNPARIVIGGGLGRAAFDLLLPGLKAELQQRVLEASRQRLQIVQSKLASSAVGAACLVWQK